MIGNDVVDLTDPETQTGATHPRFDERVFAESELELLSVSGARNRLRWMLWAAKEAAYKVARKIDPRTVFSPSRFVVRLDETLSGEVAVGDQTLRLQLREEAASVHAIVTSDDPARLEVLSGTEAIEVGSAPVDAAGNAARTLAIETVAKHLGTEPGRLTIVKVDRVPRILDGGRDTGLDLSISHHGRFVAFACEVDEAARSASR